MDKIAITEEVHPETDWFEQAKTQTLETLPEFVNHVLNDYEHDYGTICHAVSACALAAAWAACEIAGLTSFQAGFVMWDFIHEWIYSSNKCGMKIIDYDDMLYPQYEHKFEKTIKPDVWFMLQKEAKNRLENT